MCLQVYFAGLGCLKNVRAALCRGRALKCTRCGRPGATIGCRVDRCPRTYHLVCYLALILRKLSIYNRNLCAIPGLLSTDNPNTHKHNIYSNLHIFYGLWHSVFCSLVHELMVVYLIIENF